MHPRTAPAPAWRRALATAWRAAKFAFRLLFIIALAALPIPLGMMFYKPHRDRRNQPAQVLKQE